MEKTALTGPAQYKVAAHVIGWALFFFIPLMLAPGPDSFQYLQQPATLFSLLARDVLWMALFYTNLLFLTPYFLQQKNPTVYFLILLILVLAVAWCNNLFDIHFMGRPEPRPGPGPGGEFMRDGFGPPRRPGPRRILGGPFLSNLAVTFFVTVISSMIVLWDRLLEARAKEQQQSLQKIAAELSVLKLQISPHFLFNTLNNIRWLVRSGSPQAEPAIVRLSQLLRYILYQTNTNAVPLEKEIEHLRDFITLEKMRLTKPDSVEFEQTGDLQGHTIVPLLFIPLVENFFKHGDFENHDQANRIFMGIETNEVTFTTINKIMTKLHEADNQGSGIGIENLRKRLTLHYPQKHSFQMTNDGNVFRVDMKIVLS
jgi:hypothetical protein